MTGQETGAISSDGHGDKFRRSRHLVLALAVLGSLSLPQFSSMAPSMATLAYSKAKTESGNFSNIVTPNHVDSDLSTEKINLTVTSPTIIPGDAESCWLFHSQSFTKQRNISWTKNHDNCRRRCPQNTRRNQIVFTPQPDWRAGLSDRMFILIHLSNLAGYLCATLVVPRPDLLLHHNHNNQQPLAPSLVWEDFANFTWKDDVNTVDASPVISSQVDSITLAPNNSCDSYTFALISNTPEQAVADFEKVELFSMRQPATSPDRFVWHLQLYFYHMNSKFANQSLQDVSMRAKNLFPAAYAGHKTDMEKMLAEYSMMLPPMLAQPLKSDKTGCEYVKIGKSSFINQMQDITWSHIVNELSPPNASIGVFHIRRNDMKHECDTRLTKIEEYLRCSFEGSEQLLNPLVVFLASDEVDMDYRHSVEALIQKYAPAGTRVLDLDALVTTMVTNTIEQRGYPLRWNNNFVVFDIEMEILWHRGHFVLQQRRTLSCRDCDKLTWNKKLPRKVLPPNQK